MDKLKKTKYKGIYKKGNKYIFNIKVKQEDGSFKSVCRSGDTALEMYILKNKMLENEIVVERETPFVRVGKPFKEVCDEFLANAKDKISIATFYSKQTTINIHILIFFENTNVEDVVKAESITKWKQYISDRTKENQNKIMQQLKEVLKFAFFSNYITQQDYGRCELMLSRVKVEHKDKTIDFWTEEEFEKFYNAIPESDDYRVFFYTLFYTGMRIGEILGLQVKDFANGEISIKKQYNKAVIDEFRTLKTSNSYRTIRLTQANIRLLDNFIAKHNLKPDDRIFEAGRTSIKRWKNNYCKLAGVKQIRIHDFRHSHCSLLFQKYMKANVSINFLAIANRLGHTVQETMDTYSHLYPEEYQTLIDILEKKSN